MIFGERLKQLREGKFSQEELAELLNVHNNTISKWENGTQEPRTKRVSELANILGTSTAYLLGETDNPSANNDEISPNPSISRTKQKSSKEHSVNYGMLVYENKDGERFEAPATEEGIKYIERMRTLSIYINNTTNISSSISSTT